MIQPTPEQRQKYAEATPEQITAFLDVIGLTEVEKLVAIRATRDKQVPSVVAKELGLPLDMVMKLNEAANTKATAYLQANGFKQ